MKLFPRYTQFSATVDRDSNRVTLLNPLPFLASKTMTFAGGTLNDPGDFDGTGNPATLFTVTGTVLAMFFGTVTTDLVSTGNTGTLAIGTASHNLASVPVNGTSCLKEFLISGDNSNYLLGAYSFVPISANLIQTIATADITAGVVNYYCFWRPLSSNGNLTAV